MRTQLVIALTSICFAATPAMAQDRGGIIYIGIGGPPGDAGLEVQTDWVGRSDTAIIMESHIDHACGEAHHDTPCDQDCISALGQAIVVKTAPACARYCVDVPAGKLVEAVTLQARNLDQNQWYPCGAERQPGECSIGWTRFERGEWYADKRRFCVAVKNWSHNLQRGYRMTLHLKNE